ncbi:MAG TPA: DUF2267 domain-containing protein [Bryobacteraceae bacterium]|nr:DUF2267 domain-containing protein [Bryobacteraceae bacterium]
MSFTGLDVFDRTLQKTHIWLNDMMQELATDDKHQAYTAMRAALHALRDRLTIEEAAQLAAQLPMLIRGFYYEGWDPTRVPLRERSRDEFLARIADECRTNVPLDEELVARATFRVLAKRVTEGEIEDVEAMLPKEIAELWPSRAHA